MTRLLLLLFLFTAVVDAQRPFLHPRERTAGSGEPVQTTQTVFLDQFAEETSNVDLVSHTVTTGTSWTEVIDSQGAVTIEAKQAADVASPSVNQASHRILYRANGSPSLSGQDYDVLTTLNNLPTGADDPALLVFGYVDTSNYCALAIYPPNASTDVVLLKVVAGTASDLTSGTANVDPAVNDIFKVSPRDAAITVVRNGTTILTTSDTACDNGNGTGLGFGNARISTDDIHPDWRIDDFTVTQIGEDAVAVPPTVQILSPSIGSPHQTSSANVTISGTAGAGTSALDRVTITCSGDTTIAETNATGTTSWTYNAAVNVGTTVCTAKVYDVVPSSASSGTLTIIRTVTTDTTRPTIAWTSPASSPHASTVNPITITFQCSDDTACTSASWILGAGGANCVVPAPVGGVSSVSCGPIALSSGGVTNSITVIVSDGAGNLANVNTTRAITHIGDLAITTTNLPNATQNAAYSRPLAVSGGVSAYTWDNNSGGSSLGGGACTGLSISSAGVVSGTPTTIGTCNFTAKVTDSQGTPDTDTQALSIVVAVATAESAHAYFNYQVDNRGSSGANSVIQIADCASSVPGDNGGCGLRNETQLLALSKGTRSSGGWLYNFGADTHNEKQDAAKNIVPDQVKKIAGPDQLEFPFTGWITGGAGDTMTIVWDEYYTSEWLPAGCGGNNVDRLGFKQARFMSNRAGINAEWGMSRIRVDQAATMFPCSDNVVGVGMFSSQWGTGNTAQITTEVVTPFQIGVTINETQLFAAGNGTYWQAGATGQNGGRYPIYASTWTRRVFYLEFDVPANDARFAGWRADCDPTGSPTTIDGTCASMLATIPDPDSSSKWALMSMWIIDETRGARRIAYRVPWYNDYTFWQLRYEMDTSTSGITGTVTSYLRNIFFIKNITPANIDDTGCPGACAGDSGGVNANVLRKPVR